MQTEDVFEKHVHRVRQHLTVLKEKCSRFEKEHAASEWVDFLQNIQKAAFQELDRDFDGLWTYFEGVPADVWSRRKKYMEKELYDLFYDGIETNAHIRNKPLGFAGDYITMNFIYDTADGVWVGRTVYGQLMNRYTCSVDVSRSNIYRKECLKKKIIEYLQDRPGETILSVGCGSAREIFELIASAAFKDRVSINLIDMDKHALDFVASDLKKIDYDRKKIKISLHEFDLAAMVMNNKLEELFKGTGFVYASGVFDYLPQRTAQKALSGLLKITTDELVIFNMSLEGSRHRAYYEILGEWKMYHRSQQEMCQLMNGFPQEVDVLLERHEACKSYWILDVCRRHD